MSTEERFLEAIDNEDEEEVETLDHRTSRHDRLASKNKTAIDRFLGRRKRMHDVVIHSPLLRRTAHLGTQTLP